ncbi:unnamed protein product, partial [Mesorhabditis belari]|uniref:Troponin I n=1 Tax=Mesorhabditis belari TaxID=2138241 RepID=A0AAF3ERC1_9BILA
MADEEAQRKNAEREQKKAEVRKRLEESGKAGKKAKKGFLTPERKKKLRKLLMMKAAEDLKQQQLKKEQERQQALASRCPALVDIDSIEDHGKLESIYNDLFAKVCALEDSKYDVLQLVKDADQTINTLTIEVNDLRGKYVKPTLKKVSKFDNKFKKLAASKEGSEKQDFRANLKVVKKENIEEIMEKKVKKDDKPDWNKGEHKEKAEKKEEKKEEAPAPEPEPEPEPEPAAAEPAEEEEGEEEEGEDEEEEE